jgi:L-aspartate oxidase
LDGAHELGNLAPRDIGARAIDKELKGSGEEYVLLETKHLGADFIKKRFPNIYRKCLRYGFDITKRDIPVVPAAHYSCGGVVADVNGTTALAGLYVAGEVAMTGMHGANRLASNSLLEAVVMADQAARASYDFYKDTVLPDSLPVDRWPYSSLQYPRERILIAHDRRQLTRVMSDFVGIVRNEDRLVLALEKVEQIKKAIEEYYMAAPATYAVAELRNIATVAELIVRSALWRKESRGLHFVEEYPESRKDFERDTIIESRREKETV